jgi:hypothetical protein
MLDNQSRSENGDTQRVFSKRCNNIDFAKGFPDMQRQNVVSVLPVALPQLGHSEIPLSPILSVSRSKP